tara:strand:- start:1726 stop:2538 length:813 start_codon:yes stop_codon:yes gene_type:complete
MKKYKSCKFDKVNRCQKKGSAGHLGTIKSVKKKYCAKIINNMKSKELKFYNKNCSKKKRPICKFMANYDGICVDNKIKYIVLEDLTKGMSDPWVMDIKVGRITASYDELVGKKKISSRKKLKYLSKKIRHRLLSLITISNKYGFRATSLPKSKKSRLTIGMLNPQKMFSIFFKKDKKNLALTNIIKKLQKFNNFVQSEEFNEYSFVGSSILFIYDSAKNKNNKVNLAPIDFFHSRQSKKMTKNEKKYREYFREGINKLLTELIKYRDSKN